MRIPNLTALVRTDPLSPEQALSQEENLNPPVPQEVFPTQQKACGMVQMIRSDPFAAVAPRAAPARPAFSAPDPARQSLQATLTDRIAFPKSDAFKAAVTVRAAELKERTGYKLGAEAKSLLREQIEGLTKRIKILKALYAANPKELAKALAAIFKELKAAVKEFGEATKNQGEAVLKPEFAPPQEGAKSEGADEDPVALAKVTVEKPSFEAGAIEKAAREEVTAGLAQEGRDFTKQLRSLAHKIKELLEEARSKALIRPQDKPTDEAFKEADAALKELREALDSLDADMARMEQGAPAGDAPALGSTALGMTFNLSV